ncbi:MAG TPA: glycerophosphodiester phosphodiesterase [Microlunatus sp.]
MAYAPENTALSLVTAEQLGVDEIEFDVRVSADGVPVISHDDDLARVLGTDDAPLVSRSRWDELQQLKLPRGQRLLSLPEALELTQSDLQVEVKAPEAAALVAEVLADFPGERTRCLLTSFQAPILAELKERLPDIPRGLIAGSYSEELVAVAVEVAAVAILTGWDGLTPDVVDRLHGQGFKVAAWPLRDADDARRATELGVDMITADAPDRARAWVEAAAQQR